MIIKNPYRFISRNYKIICFLLLIPLVYLCFKYWDIAKFFRDYISSNYHTFDTIITDKYITPLCLGTIIFMIVINTIIIFVFSTRKREFILHLILVIYALVLGIATFFFSITMNSIEAAAGSTTTIRVMRDLANIISIPGFIIIPITIAKAIGFNFKTFRIERQFDNLAYEDEDGMNDEIEIKVNDQQTSARGGIVHILREIKYYILENKFVMKCLGIGLLIIIAISMYMNFQVYNKKYTANQSFVLDNFSMALKESYITNVDYKGNVIANDKYYLAVKLTIKNTKQKYFNKDGSENGGKNEKNSLSIDSSNFRIFIGDKEIFPSYDRASRFIDIGKDYRGEKIGPQSVNDYVFVYELTEDELQTNYQMKILTNSQLNDSNKLVNSYKILSIKPDNILKTEKLGKIKIGNEVSLEDTVLWKTTYKLNSAVIMDSFPYEYKVCNINNKCNTIRDTIVQSGGNTLLVINDEIKWDESSSYYKNSNKDFYGDFVKIEYTYTASYGGEVNKRTESSYLKNVTPENLEGNKIYEIPAVVKRAESKRLIISIRNKVYTIDLE